MAHPKKSVIIVGNWKMHKTIAETVDYLQHLIPLVRNSTAKILLAVPFTALHAAAECTKNTSIMIGAQNMHDAEEGAFTGEISGRMLVEAGARFVILGHSERRHLFHESSEWISRKVKRAFYDGLLTILCVGETWDEREAGKTKEVLESQLLKSIGDLGAPLIKNLILAYEPVWAIGTKKSASPDIAEQAHLLCRRLIASHFSSSVAEEMSILYGGSVNPENAFHFIQQPDINGLLIGGASLSVDSFSKIAYLQEPAKYP